MARNNHFPGSTGHVPVNMDQDAVGFLFASRTFSLLWSQFNKILKSLSAELIFSNHSNAICNHISYSNDTAAPSPHVEVWFLPLVSQAVCVHTLEVGFSLPCFIIPEVLFFLLSCTFCFPSLLTCTS